MKRNYTIILLLVACMSIFSCTKKQNADEFAINNQASEQSKVVQLYTDSFVEKVCEINLNAGEKNFKYKGDKPCIIDFYATWCGPCKKQAPIFESLAEKYGDDIYFYKVDVDQAREVAMAFNIRSIPTLIICPKPGNAMLLQGLQSQELLEEIIQTQLLNKE